MPLMQVNVPLHAFLHLRMGIMVQEYQNWSPCHGHGMIQANWLTFTLEEWETCTPKIIGEIQIH